MVADTSHQLSNSTAFQANGKHSSCIQILQRSLSWILPHRFCLLNSSCILQDYSKPSRSGIAGFILDSWSPKNLKALLNLKSHSLFGWSTPDKLIRRFAGHCENLVFRLGHALLHVDTNRTGDSLIIHGTSCTARRDSSSSVDLFRFSQPSSDQVRNRAVYNPASPWQALALPRSAKMHA